MSEHALKQGTVSQNSSLSKLYSDDATINEKSKDSVFVDLFRQKENILQLYKALHPEDTEVTVDDISIKTLKTILVNTIYNDLGFIVRHNDIDKYILLVEAQSWWNPNMSLRMFFYLAETYRKYIRSTKQSEHSNSRVKLPKAELYVVYSGDDRKAPDMISFNEDYFDGTAPVDLKVKVLDKVDDTIYGQYIGFCKVYNEQKKLYDNTLKCIEESINICIRKGYLTEYLSQHKEEVITMMSELFDEQAQREAYNEARDNEMLNKGLNMGLDRGKSEGKSEEKISIARNLLALGAMAKEQIAAVTGLSIAKIEELAGNTKPILT